MYTDFELFEMASNSQKKVFVSNVTMSILDDADGCVDLDAEKKRLGTIWRAAQMSLRDMVDATGLSQRAFGQYVGIPMRTVQNWCAGINSCPLYTRFLLAEHYGLFEKQK